MSKFDPDRRFRLMTGVAEALQRMKPLLARLEEPAEPIPPGYWPPPPYPNTPAQIRRTISRLHAGKARPVDPSVSPRKAAWALRRVFTQDQAREQLEKEIELLRQDLYALSDQREAEFAAADLELFFTTHKLENELDDPLREIIVDLYEYLKSEGRSHRRAKWAAARAKAGMKGNFDPFVPEA
jgi:hypothetical protein